jgi:hypothetical protein
MKTFLRLALVALLTVFMAAPAQAEIQDFLAYVHSWDGTQNLDGKPMTTRITSGITFKVLAKGADTAETLYYPTDIDGYNMTSLTNPVSASDFGSATVCNDRVAFRTDPTDSADDRYVDLIVVDTAGGYTQVIKNFDKHTRTIVLDQRPNTQHHGMIWYADTDTTEIDTGIDFDYDTMILGVQVEVVTEQTSGTINVGTLSSGTSGDADGFVVGTDISSAGYVLQTLATTGALLDDGTNFNPNGYTILSADEQSLTYTMGTTTGTGAGYIHYRFIRTR